MVRGGQSGKDSFQWTTVMDVGKTLTKKKYIIVNSGSFPHLEVFVDAKQIESSWRTERTEKWLPSILSEKVIFKVSQFFPDALLLFPDILELL